MNIQRILVPTDFSDDAETALQWGRFWAQRFEAELHLLHVLDEYDANWYESSDAFSQLSIVREQVEANVQEGLQTLVSEPEEAGIRTETAFRRGHNVANAIRDYAQEIEADCIVMGSVGRGWLGSVLLGSTAEQVIRKARRPVLTVRREKASEEALEVRRVLAPVDFSEHAQEAVRTAKQFAAVGQARLDLLFVAEERMVPAINDTGIPMVRTIRMDPGIVKNSEKALRQLSEEVGGPDVDVHGHFAEGNVASRIVEFAETHEISLIVMATRGLSGLDRWLMGSVTQRVVRKAPCPVLTFNTGVREE